MRRLPAIRRGRPTRSRHVHDALAAGLRVEFREPTFYMIDGDIMEPTTQLDRATRARWCASSGGRVGGAHPRRHRRQRSLRAARHPRRRAGARQHAVRRRRPTSSCAAAWATSRWSSCRATAAATACCRREINFRANIFALKQLGVEWLVSVGAVGSLREHARAGARGGARPVHRPHRGAAEHVLRRRHRRARQPCRPGVSACCRRRRAGAARRRRHRAPRRHLRLHGGAAVLDPRRVAPVPPVGRRRHRHDQLAGGQAGARGGDLLRQPGAGDRLRLLEVRRRRTS